MSPLLQRLQQRATQDPAGILYLEGDQSITNAEALQAAFRMGEALRCFAGKAKMIAAAVDGAYDLYRLIWASQVAGLSLAFLPIVTEFQQTREAMTGLSISHLITDSQALIEAGMGLHPSQLDAEPGPCSEMAPSQPAILIQTSGTTGTGKWVAITNTQIATVLDIMGSEGTLVHKQNQVAFITPPLSHSYGFSSAMEYLWAGSTLCFPQGTSPMGPTGELRAPTLSERVTAIEGVPFFYNQMARLLRRLSLPKLKHIGFGGGKLDENTVELFQKKWPELSYSARYGMTETPSVVSNIVFNPPYENDWQCAGTISAAYQVRIADEKGEDVPEGEEGEILLTGNNLAWPYYGEARHDQDFFATGDLGRVVGNRLWILGRRSFFLKHGGYRFSPEHVESIMNMYPGVLDAHLYMADTELTADLVTGEDEVNFSDLRLFISNRIPAYAVPKNLKRVPEIARTPSGKIKRHAVHGTNARSAPT